MDVKLIIPDALFERNRIEIASGLLEQAATEAFRTGAISLGRLAEILDLTLDEASSLVKADNRRSEISVPDIEEGRETIKTLFGQQ